MFLISQLIFIHLLLAFKNNFDQWNENQKILKIIYCIFDHNKSVEKKHHKNYAQLLQMYIFTVWSLYNIFYNS